MKPFSLPTTNTPTQSNEVDCDSVRFRIETCEFLLDHYITSEKYSQNDETFNKRLVNDMNGIINGLREVEKVFMKFEKQ